ncbi:hypothetical protein GOQ29_11795 [Clostridium sp. D2Q-14]|uniref:hypothetical protein n=1 Tax=Anaeromonas gelatinilytica TaxID=2683194 RepID=UPI00193C1A0D|nr:hypothetical protein [Anaeromonas gelatinilytica]MBS4536301.1 hypothetical protein [Anaeromonas gelatinilytica]
MNFKYLKFIIIYSILHITIDTLKNLIESKKFKEEIIGSIDTKFYMIYQISHIIIIYILGELFIGKKLNYWINISDELLKWLLLLIIIIKPVNLNFKILFQKYAPEEFEEERNTIDGAGAIIGNLERLLISVFLYYNQFGAIGLVFTAKSVARFNKILKSPSFAEYYLIGSLFSIISVLVCYAIVFG